MGNNLQGGRADPEERAELRAGASDDLESSLRAPSIAAEASHVALDVDTDSENENSQNSGHEEVAASPPRPMNIYFGQVMASLTADENDELFGFSRDANTVDATHPLTTLAQLSSQASSTQTVTSLVNLNRDSLRFSENSLSFLVDSLARARAEFFVHFDENAATASPFYVSEVGEGIGQVFSDDKLRIDLSTWSDSELTHVESSGLHPLAIRLKPHKEALAGEVEHQWTFAEFVKSADSTFEVRTTKQSIKVNGLIYVVHDIFGINHADPASPVKEDCVICLTEVRDTIVIPCRHLCVCHQCAQVLRYQSNKCPICRGPARAMLRLEVTGAEDDEEDGSDTDKSGREVKKEKDVVSSSVSAVPLVDKGASLL